MWHVDCPWKCSPYHIDKPVEVFLPDSWKELSHSKFSSCSYCPICGPACMSDSCLCLTIPKIYFTTNQESTFCTVDRNCRSILYQSNLHLSDICQSIGLLPTPHSVKNPPVPKDLDILCLFPAKNWVSDWIGDLLSSDGTENGWCFPDIMYSYSMSVLPIPGGKKALHERAAVVAVCSQRLLLVQIV